MPRNRNEHAKTSLFASVLQIRRTCNHRIRVAGDRAQVLVDCLQLVIGHVLKGRSAHHLQKIAVERRQEAVGRRIGRSAIRMDVVEVGAVPHDLDELLVSAPPSGSPVLSGVKFRE
jgi:hypothetical protein